MLVVAVLVVLALGGVSLAVSLTSGRTSNSGGSAAAAPTTTTTTALPTEPTFSTVATIPFEGESDAVGGSCWITITPDGKRAVMTYGGTTAFLIDTETPAVTGQVTVDDGAARVAFAPDGRAYVTGNEGVSVVDAAGAVVAFVPMAEHPADVTVSPDGSRVYVSLYDSQDIPVIDTASNTVVATVDAGGEHTGDVAFTPDGRRVYVARQDELRVVDTTTAAVSATLALEGYPADIAIARDGRRAYLNLVLGSDEPGVVAVVDTATNTVVATVPGGGHNAAIALSPDGRFGYVASGNDGTLAVLELAGGTVVATVPVLGVPDVELGPNEFQYRPAGLAVTPDGRKVFVSSAAGVTVVQVDGV